jgi:hypothetical protein
MGIALQQGAPVSPILFVIKMQFAFLNASLGDLKGDFTTIIKRAPSSVFWLSATATCYLDDVALMAAREKVASDGIGAPPPLGQKVLTQVEKELQVGKHALKHSKCGTLCLDYNSPQPVKREEAWVYRKDLPFDCAHCQQRFFKQTGRQTHQSNCPHRYDPTLMIDPALHRIVRPFGEVWNRFYLIETLNTGRCIAWAVMQIKGAQAVEMIDKMWELMERVSATGRTTPRERKYSGGLDEGRCEYCGVMGPHEFSRKMVTDEEKERHVVQCEAMCGASSGKVTAAEHRRICLHKYAPQGRDSGVAEGVHRAKMKKRASEKSKLSTSNGEIPNVASETCLGHTFSADGNSRVALDHRIAKATGSFNSLHPVWKHPNLSLKHKLMIYEGSTSLCLLWGGEAWVWDQVHKGLNSFNAGCLSRFTGRSRVDEAKDPSINIKNLLTRRQLSFLGRKLRGPPTASALRAILARLTPVEGTLKGSSHGGKEMPSCTHAQETQRAQKSTWKLLDPALKMWISRWTGIPRRIESRSLGGATMIRLEN